MMPISLASSELFDEKQFDIRVTSIPTSRGVRNEAIIVHKGLMKNRSMSSTDSYVLEQKVYAQIHVWDDMWKKQVERDKAVEQRQMARLDKEQKKQLAADRTYEAQMALDRIKNTLTYTLKVDDSIDWDSLKDKSTFKKPKPTMKSPPAKPDYRPLPREPLATDREYRPRLNILDLLISSWKAKKIEAAKETFDRAYSEWKQRCIEVEECNRSVDDDYSKTIKAIEKEYAKAIHDWEKDKRAFENTQSQANTAIDQRHEQYKQKMPEAIIDYCDMVLSRSSYPDSFPKQWQIDYNPENHILIVDFQLPSIADLPIVKEIKYIQTRDEFTEINISDTESNRIYDDLLYQISLRTIHELYEADRVAAIDSIVFNGWVRSLDRATGKEITPCILTIQAKREEFLAINLEKVEPKACFKMLKGVSGSKLSSLAPVAPLMQINREDRRFIDSYAVADGIQDGDNLAAMDWEDFEHLIRELFEKEFAQEGAEVRVTQASRDGGVDAVVFDPDPLRGGKIVIQAKRYTNTVTVSAVRDLYGTVVNEGAIKGILVTTADYGADAYEFAKGKPLTLLNGGNLLHLLERHGHRARIDLIEAKRILTDGSQ